MKEVLMFCESYDEITSCLYIAKCHSKQKHSITIAVPGNHDLYRFLDEVNERVFHNCINLLSFDLFNLEKPNGGVIRKAFHYINQMIKEKRYYALIYKKRFFSFFGAQVYFFTRYLNPYDFYFLNRLYKRNNLTLMQVRTGIGNNLSKYPPHNIRDLLKLVRLKYVFGGGMIFASVPHRVFEYISDRFVEKRVKRIIDIERGERLLQAIDYNRFRVFDDRIYSVIYFDQPLDRSKRVDVEVFKGEIDRIFKVISKYFPSNEVAIKYHPTLHGNKTLIKYGTVLEDYIPAELLYDDKVKMYLSFSSGAIANVEKGLAVSLIDLISFKDNEVKKSIKERLVQRCHSKILFPQSLDELERIIINVQKQAL